MFFLNKSIESLNSYIVLRLIGEGYMKRFRDVFDYPSHTIIDSEIKNDFDCNPEKYKKCLDSSILTHMHTRMPQIRQFIAFAFLKHLLTIGQIYYRDREHDSCLNHNRHLWLLKRTVKSPWFCQLQGENGCPVKASLGIL